MAQYFILKGKTCWCLKRKVLFLLKAATFESSLRDLHMCCQMSHSMVECHTDGWRCRLCCVIGCHACLCILHYHKWLHQRWTPPSPISEVDLVQLVKNHQATQLLMPNPWKKVSIKWSPSIKGFQMPIFVNLSNNMDMFVSPDSWWQVNLSACVSHICMSPSI